MEIAKDRPRFWPFVALVIVGLFLIGGVVVYATADQNEIPAVELPK
jgi:hypothetical protein